MALKQCISGFKYETVILGIYVKLHGGMGKTIVGDLGWSGFKGNKLPKTFPPKQLFLKELDGSSRLWGFWTTSTNSWSFSGWCISKNYDFFLKVILGFFRHKKPHGNLGSKGLLLKALLFFCSHAGAPPNKKSGENRKYQPLNAKFMDWFFRIFAARGPFQADSSSVHLCCDWALMPFVLCCLVLAASVAPCPLVRPGVNYPLYFFGYIIHIQVHLWNDPPVCKYSLINCVGWCGQIMWGSCLTSPNMTCWYGESLNIFHYCKGAYISTCAWCLPSTVRLRVNGCG